MQKPAAVPDPINHYYYPVIPDLQNFPIFIFLSNSPNHFKDTCKFLHSSIIKKKHQMKSGAIVLTCYFSLFSLFLIAQQPVYKDPKQPIAKRVSDLLSRMTLEEKVAQLQTMHAGRPKLDDKLFNNTGKLDSLYKNGMGMINPAFDETMEQTIIARNRLQDYMINKTRLGIPIIFIDEAHHGLVQRQVDVFPHGIGLSCSWDVNLLEKIYAHAAGQARVRGTSLVLAPVVDVCRDPRWGRTGETLGEDPYLCGMLGSAIVRGFQGSNNGTIAPGHVGATLKHFSGMANRRAAATRRPPTIRCASSAKRIWNLSACA
jgi:beta-glucosidase